MSNHMPSIELSDPVILVQAECSELRQSEGVARQLCEELESRVQQQAEDHRSLQRRLSDRQVPLTHA